MIISGSSSSVPKFMAWGLIVSFYFQFVVGNCQYWGSQRGHQGSLEVHRSRCEHNFNQLLQNKSGCSVNFMKQRTVMFFDPQHTYFDWPIQWSGPLLVKTLGKSAEEAKKLVEESITIAQNAVEQKNAILVASVGKFDGWFHQETLIPSWNFQELCSMMK